MKRMVILGSDDAIRRDLEDAVARRSTGSSRGVQARPIPYAARPKAVAFIPSAPVAAPAPPAPPTSPPRELPTGSLKEIARHAAREAERDLIFKTLQQTRWNRREAAGRLGISYKALLYKIKDADAHQV